VVAVNLTPTLLRQLFERPYNRGTIMRKSLPFDFNGRARGDKQANWARILVLGLCIARSFLSASSSPAGEVKPGWEAEWEKTVAAAKREGQVNLYGTDPSIEIVETGVFQKAFPGIKVVTGAGGFGQATQRLMAERRAGKYIADLYIAGLTSPLSLYQMKVLEPIKPLLMLPEVVDESKWLGGKHKYTDPEQRYIFVYTANPLFGSITYNTNLVNPKEIRSFWDLVHPKWKGKIAVRDIRVAGTGNINTIFFYHNPLLGPKFVRRLFGEMDITLFRDVRQGVDWLASGKFAICFYCSTRDVLDAQKQGLPVDEFGLLKEGAALSSHGGTMGFVNRTPHPNATKVFVNWLLSRDGQITAQRVGPNSRRIDVPKEMIPPPFKPLAEGVQYLDVETPELNDIKPVLKVIEEALAEAEKRKKGK
jgi:iron(III) transport system substrate-binding protein